MAPLGTEATRTEFEFHQQEANCEVTESSNRFRPEMLAQIGVSVPESVLEIPSLFAIAHKVDSFAQFHPDIEEWAEYSASPRMRRCVGHFLGGRSTGAGRAERQSRSRPCNWRLRVHPPCIRSPLRASPDLCGLSFDFERSWGGY